MIFKIKTDDEVTGIDIMKALNKAGIKHDIISKQRDAKESRLLNRVSPVSGEANEENYILWKNGDLPKETCVCGTVLVNGKCNNPACEYNP